MDVTPDGKRAFVADGAVITILDLEPTTPAVITQIPVPDCQPLAMRYYQVPGTGGSRWLFIAGGTLGLWAIPLCPELMGSPPHLCALDPVPTRVWLVDCAHSLTTGTCVYPYEFERKRCVAVAVLDAPTAGAGDPVLFALFAASSSPSQSDIGATELRAYRIDASGIIPLSSGAYMFPNTSSGPPAVGTCLAVDNANNPNSVFVGLGRGGIWRAELSSTGVLSATLWSAASGTAGAGYVSDMTTVNVLLPPPIGASRSFLYAAMDYDGTLTPRGGTVREYDLSQSSPTPSTVAVLCGYPARIATSLDGTNVRVALALYGETQATAETFAPAVVNGYWTGLCVGTGAIDPYAPQFPGGPTCSTTETVSHLSFYSRDLNTTSTLTENDEMKLDELEGPWGSLALLNLSGTYRLYTCTQAEATEVWDVNWNFHPVLRQTYAGNSFGATKATVSALNPEIFRFGVEEVGKTNPQGSLARIASTSPYTITPIAHTLSACPNGTAPITCVKLDSCKPRDPNPFTGSLLGEAHWIDPNDPNPAQPTQELFFTGAHTVQRMHVATSGQCVCDFLDDCAQSGTQIGPWDPCSDPTVSWADATLPHGPSPQKAGWKLVRLTLPSSGTPDGNQMDMKWRQLAAPRASMDNAASDDYISSVLDDRNDPSAQHPTPSVVYGIRGGSDKGLKVFKPADLDVTAQPCMGSSGLGGSGEEIVDGTYVDAPTHIEFETVGGDSCGLGAYCDGPGAPRQLFNNQAEFFSVRMLGGRPKKFLAVAAGFVNCAANAGHTCQWATLHKEQPLIDVFDVTNTGDGTTFAIPQLLRVALGDEQGNAFSVRVKSYVIGGVTKIYAFVANAWSAVASGTVPVSRVLVFNMTELQTDSPPPPGTPYITFGQFITPVAHGGVTVDVRFPIDPYDGQPANVVDLAIDGNYLYCALARTGVGVVDITDPENPMVCDILDTPGVVEALTVRPLATGHQLIVGDSRCGVRVYQ
jgi:hypothetical protein